MWALLATVSLALWQARRIAAALPSHSGAGGLSDRFISHLMPPGLKLFSNRERSN